MLIELAINVLFVISVLCFAQPWLLESMLYTIEVAAAMYEIIRSVLFVVCAPAIVLSPVCLKAALYAILCAEPLLFSYVVALIVILMVGVLSYIERVLLATVQYRIGPDVAALNGLAVLVLDGIKLYGKSRMYIGTSLVGVLISTVGLIMTCQLLYVLSLTTVANLEFDNILIVFLLISDFSLLTCLIPIAITYSTYTILGTTRLLIASMVSEIASMLILIFFFCTSGIESQSYKYLISVSCFLGCLLLYIVCWVETGRVPYDLVEAESEIVAGDNTDYSGVVFGMAFIGELSELVMYTSLIVFLLQVYLLPGVLLVTFLILASYSGRIMLCRYPAKSLISFIILDVAVLPLYILAI